MEKIVSECCGSCDHWKSSFNKCHLRSENHRYYDSNCEKDYSPRNPIDNPYKKYKDIWEELKEDLKISESEIDNTDSRRAIQHVINFIWELEEKYK
jgi:hypothetical protein